MKVARIGSGGAIDPPVTVGSDASTSALPSIAALPNGDADVAWSTGVDEDENGAARGWRGRH